MVRFPFSGDQLRRLERTLRAGEKKATASLTREAICCCGPLAPSWARDRATFYQNGHIINRCNTSAVRNGLYRQRWQATIGEALPNL